LSHTLLTAKVSKYNGDYAIIYLPKEVRDHISVKAGDRIQFQASVDGGQKVILISKAPERSNILEDRSEFDF